jgi:ParB family transcriptional regulator, chromosome partitioning protein
MMLIQIRRIKVGERRREEMGDVAGLAASIKRHELIQPIMVDGDLNLVAGGRRLRAYQLLGWDKIEARVTDAVKVVEGGAWLGGLRS